MVHRAGKDHDWSTPYVYTHIGHEYGQSWGVDGRTTVTDSQEFYTDTLEPIAIPSGSRTRGLTEAEFGDLRILNGEMGYGKDCRPDAMGRVGFSQQNVDKDAVVQHLIEANEALKVLQDPAAVKHLTFGPIDIRKAKVVGIADGALRKKSEKYSQGCLYVLLMEVKEGHTGGVCHVLVFRTNRATRVSKSSMGAEVLIQVRCSEVCQRVAGWLHEIWYGVESARDLLAIPNPVPVQLVSDAHDIFATLQCSRPYQGADESLSSYMECLREDLLTGAVDEFLWVPTTSMLADGGSKVMDDKLAQALLRDGGWWPEEYKLLQRATMDGAELQANRR